MTFGHAIITFLSDAQYQRIFSRKSVLTFRTLRFCLYNFVSTILFSFACSWFRLNTAHLPPRTNLPISVIAQSLEIACVFTQLFYDTDSASAHWSVHLNVNMIFASSVLWAQTHSHVQIASLAEQTEHLSIHFKTESRYGFVMENNAIRSLLLQCNVALHIATFTNIKIWLVFFIASSYERGAGFPCEIGRRNRAISWFYVCC